MKSAYLYIRVSTDEQKRKGYSLPEQEDRLFKYCESNDIEVKGIFREDFSAKNFNRPEWKKLIASIKRNPGRELNNILFVKWDRFSRNIELAYEMIGILRKYNVTAMAIDQPIDFCVPESTVMLAVYLSIPEAENSRRALNTANGLRRAREFGRYPNKAPLGFANLAMPDGRKYIAPSQPDADIVKWCFQQLAKNSYKIEEVRRMGVAKGLKCSRSNFWKIMRNPVYCGLIPLSLKTEDFRLVKALHEPLISEKLFYEVQNIITTKKKIVGKTNQLKETFPLIGYLSCPTCSRKLRGSFSKGSTKRYPYYHCSGTCKIRFKAELVNENYNEKLQGLELSDSAIELLSLALEDVNTTTYRTQYLYERTTLLKRLEEQDSLISKARRLFVADQLKFDDFSELKEEYRTISGILKKEVNTVMSKLNSLDEQIRQARKSLKALFKGYQYMCVSDKRQIISLIPPAKVHQEGSFSLRLNNALAKILKSNAQSGSEGLVHSFVDDSIAYNSYYFADKKVTVNRAIATLLRNSIQVNDQEASVILNFLYHIAQCYNKQYILNPK